MSICLFLVRNISSIDTLRIDLVSYAKAKKFGVDFHPFDILLTHRQIPLTTWDFVFSLCDSFEYTSCDCVLYPDGAPINGRTHYLPFIERMIAVQKIAEIVLKYKDEVELFLSDDNPYLPEFINCDVFCQNVAETLCLQYRECQAPYDIPSVHMRIHSNS